jgi:probable addiction module antidote protein
MPKRTRAYRESLLGDLQDPSEASAYLNAAMDDSDSMFLVALRDVAEANQMAKVAAGAGVARESIYRMLNKSGNPTLSSLRGILASVNLKIRVEPVESTLDAPEQPTRDAM